MSEYPYTWCHCINKPGSPASLLTCFSPPFHHHYHYHHRHRRHRRRRPRR